MNRRRLENATRTAILFATVATVAAGAIQAAGPTKSAGTAQVDPDERCQGMQKGDKCITPADRKAAAKRAKDARDAADGQGANTNKTGVTTQ